MYVMGTNCTCGNCGKKWVITYKDFMEYQKALNMLKTNNMLARNIINQYWNGELLQYNHCPYCRNPMVSIERFYYEIDNNYNYMRDITEQEYIAENQKIYNINQQQQLEKQLKTNHIWTIIILILFYPIGLVMLWNDKYIGKEKRENICRFLTPMFLVITIISLILGKVEQKNLDNQLHSRIPDTYNYIDINYLTDNYSAEKVINIKGAVCISQQGIYNIEDGISIGDKSLLYTTEYISSDYRDVIRDGEEIFLCGDVTIMYKYNDHWFSDDEYYVSIRIDNAEIFLGQGTALDNVDSHLFSSEKLKKEEKLVQEKIEREAQAEKDRIEEEARKKAAAEEARKKAEQEEAEARSRYSIYEENGVVYATANDIVDIAENNISAKKYFNLNGNVCVTGKIKNTEHTQGYLLETVTGNFRTYKMYTTSDTIYLDNDKMESSIGITVNVESKINSESFNKVIMYIAQAEEYSTAKTDLYIFNDAYYWMEKQAELGNLKDGVTVRVYGAGSWGWFDTYEIDCTKVEILNEAGNVVSTFEYIQQ